MDGAQAVVYVDVVAGKPHREWCDRCLTSARLVIDLHALTDDGPTRIGTILDGCTRCDPEIFD